MDDFEYRTPELQESKVFIVASNFLVKKKTGTFERFTVHSNICCTRTAKMHVMKALKCNPLALCKPQMLATEIGEAEMKKS